MTNSIADDDVESWHLIERGATWNRYRYGDTLQYRLQSYGDLINYKDEKGDYHSINITKIALQSDGSHVLEETPYRFKLDKTFSFFSIWFDRNNPDEYVDIYFPSLKINDVVFYKFFPIFLNDEGIICWSFADFDVQLRLDNSKFFFEYIMKNDAAPKNFDVKAVPHGISFDEIPFINVIKDATGTVKQSNVEYDKELQTMKISVDTNGLAYPIVVDPSLTFYSGLADCHIKASGRPYNVPWTAVTGTIDNTTMNSAGQQLIGTFHYINRSFLFFDTDIDSLATITNASINLYVTSSTLGSTKYVVIQNGQPTYPSFPPIAGNYNKAYYSGNGGQRTSFVNNSYNAIYFSSTGIDWINYTDMTKLCLRSSNDVSGTAPTASERIIYRSADYAGTTSDPYLQITYQYYIETSVDALPSIVYSSPHDVNVTGPSGLDNVSLLYRYTDEYGERNRTFAISDGVGDKNITFTQGAPSIDTHYQTFSVPHDCYFGNLSLWAKKDTGNAKYRVSFYRCNATGCPKSGIFGNSTDSAYADMGTSYDWVSVGTSTPIFFEAGTTYGFRLVVTPASPGHNVNIAYNDSNSYDYLGGSRWKYSTSLPPTWYEYAAKDFLFKMNFSWIQWNDSANPDIASPWSFAFNFTDGEGIYEFYSFGSYLNVKENYSFMNDSWCRYAELPIISNPVPTDGATGVDFDEVDGLNTSVNVTYSRFVELNESNLGTGIIANSHTTGENDVSYVQAGIIFGQQFNLTQSIVFMKSKTKIGTANIAGGGSLYFNLYECNESYFPIGGSLATSSIAVNLLPFKTYDWVITNFTPVELKPGKYALLLSYNNLVTTIGWKMENPGTYADGTGIYNAGTWTQGNIDHMFYIYGWSLGGNISWNHVVNLTYSSNSSGSWQQYGFKYACQNGTFTANNSNFSSALTKYYWNVTGYVYNLVIGDIWCNRSYNFTTKDLLNFDINRTLFNFGAVEEDIIVYSNATGEPDTFTLYNNGTCNIDVDIRGTNLTAVGVDPWVLSATNGDNMYKMEIYNSSTGWRQVNLTADTWISNMASSTNKTANLRMTTPTVFYSGKQMAGTIYMVASIH